MPDVGLGSWPLRRARIAPDAVALRQGERALAYGELARRVDALAGALAALGVGKGDRVAYLGPNDVATFETFFAAGRLGAIFLALNTRAAAAEISYMLSDSGAAVLVHGPETAELVAAAQPGAHGVCAIVALDTASAELGAQDYEELIAAGHPEPPARDVSLADDALILYTSGTTGRPKGAVLTHGNITFNTMSQLAHLDVLGGDVALCTAPMFHVTGLGLVSLPTLFKGGSVVMAPKFDPAWLLRTIAEQRVNAFSAVPTMLQMLLDHPDWESADLGSMRYVVYGGSPAIERVTRAWQERGVQMLQGYGMTEAAPGIFQARPGDAEERPMSAGVPLFFADAAISGPDGAHVDPPGEGELLVRGPNVFRGYWNRPEETAASFDGGWFRTGDVLRVEEDGSAYVVDRVKDMFISGGENVYPAEVEAVLGALPGVAACAVVGVADERWGEVGCAFVVRAPGATIEADAVRAHLAAQLARFKVPREVRFVDQLPRTASGKVRKDVLRGSVTQSSAGEAR